MLSREPAPARFRTGPRRLLIILGALLLVLLLTLRQLATFWTDFLWFSSIEQTSVWATLVWTRVLLVIIASLVAFSLLWLNLVLADRLSPRTGLIAGGPDEELIERFQFWIEPRIRRVRLIVAMVFGVLIGLSAGAWWEDWLLFNNSVKFGIDDPQFGTDVSFYVFRLPFYRDLFGWAFQFFVVTTLIVAALHYLNGGIQIQSQFQRVKPGVKVHLSVLLAMLAVLKAIGYQLDKFDLLYSPAGQVFGASYTDVNARLPALNLLILISLFAAALLLVNIRFRGWTLPAVAVGLWLVTSVIVGAIIPAAVQRFRVEPDEVNKELPFVARNIAFTRDAYGLSGVEVREFPAMETLPADVINNNRPTIDNLRLWDPSVLETTYRQLQELRTYYKFDDVDVDRYPLPNGLTQVMLSARELDQENIPARGWVNTHLVFTHGFGAVLSPANDVTAQGQPAFLVRDIPPANLSAHSGLDVEQPRIYFGEGFRSGSFVIAGTNEREVDFPLPAGGEAVSFTSYEGQGGVEVGGFFRRAAFALRFADFNTLISSRVTGDSRILMVRNVVDRVRKLAPFLYTDADPYLVLLDGRLVWVVDMYTVTDRYPYSEPAETARLDRDGSTLPGGFNYIRNSVKTVVDAFDGTMDFYVVDPTDPVLAAYKKIFPSIFRDQSEMPPTLLEHLRYPEDLFRVQSDMYNAYHVTDARVFFNEGDPWGIARDPSTTNEGPLRNPGVYVDSNGRYQPMVPYYLLIRLPGESDLSFLILQPFTPENRPNMVSFLAAKSGPNQYGQLIDFQLPRDRLVDGPGQVGARINQDPEISREFTLLGQEGSEVIQGNMLVVPIEESIMYVQPIYISARGVASGQAAGEAAALPEFKKVVVVFQDQIAMRDSLDQALFDVFGAVGPPTGEPPTGEPPTGEPPGEVPSEVGELLAQAQAAFDAADAALKDGNLALYADKIAEAQGFIDQAVALITEAP